jgi:multiple sugar transport system ATP-binding protein
MAVGKIVRPDDNGDLAVRLGLATIRLHPAVARQRPALAAYVARDVAVGIRSEDMEDARLVRDAPADTKALEKDAHTEDVPTHEIGGTKFVAAFAPRSRVKVGDQIEVVVDTERMHFFDPGTGAAIRG